MGDKGWSRRGFLAGSGAAVALGLTAAACSGDDDDDDDEVGSGGAGDFDPSDWDSVRSQFALDEDLHHFAAFVFAAHPRPVADAIARYREALDADTDGALEQYADREAASREAAAGYLGVEADQIALTDSTTMGLGLLYGSLRLEPGDELLTTEHDFYSTHEALRWRALRGGHEVRRARLYDEAATASADGIVSRLLDQVTPATRVMAVTWVHSSTGVRLPIADIAAALADVNDQRDEAQRVLLCVDGVHGFGAVDADVADLGCDFLVSGTHKWLFGPRGTGLVWGRPEAWARLDPVIPPFSQEGFDAWSLDQAEVSRAVPGTLFTPGGFHSFEHRWALADAFQFHADIGRDKVAGWIEEQATALKEGLAGIDGVEVVTPTDPGLSAGIVCVALGDRQPFSLLAPLREQGFVASTTPYDPSYLRFGPSMVTNLESCDRLIEAAAGLVQD